MKKYLHNFKFLSLALGLMLIASVANAQKTAVADGNWSLPGTWSPVGAPGAGETVTINNGIDVIVDGDFTCSSVTFANASGSISVNTTRTLTVTTSITLQNSNTANTAATLTGAGSIICATVQVGGTVTAPTADRTTILTSTVTSLSVSGNFTIRAEDNGANQGNATFNLGTGTVTVGGSVVLDAEDDGGTASTSTIDLNTGAESGTLSIAGATPFTFPGGGNLIADFTGTTATVNYSGAAQTIAATTYRNLTVTNVGVKTIPSDLTINGNLTINTGSTLTAPAGGSDDLTVAGNWVNNGTFNGGDDLVTFNGGTQTIGGSTATTFNNLTVSSSTSTSLLLNASVTGNLTVTTGDFFDLSTFACNRTVAGGTLTVAGTMRLGSNTGGQTGSNFPTNFSAVTLTGGTVEYDGSNAITQTVFATPAYENIILTNGTGSGIADKIITANVTMNGTLTVNANTVLTPGATNVFSAGTTNTITGTGTIKVTRIAATPDYVSQYDFDTDDLNQLAVDYAGLGNQTINAFTYGSLLTSGSGTKTMSAATTVNDNFTVGGGTILDEAGITLSVAAATINIDGTLNFSSSAGSITTTGAGANTLTMGSSGVIRTVDPLGIGPVAAGSFIQGGGGGTFVLTSISTNGTVEYYAAVAQALTDRDYNNLAINTTAGAKTWTLGANRTVNGDLTMEANAPFTLAGGNSILLRGDWVDNSTGTFTQGTTVINFNGSAAQEIRGTQSTTFSGITFSNTLPGTGICITVLTQAFVNGVVTFTDGVVSTNGSLITLNGGSTIAGTPSNASHIDGPVKKLGSFVTPPFRFPVGDAGQYEFLEIQGSIGVAYDFTAQYNRTSATAIDGDVISPILNVSACDHWVLNPGTSVPTATVTLTISWSDLTPCGGNNFVTQPSSLTVGHYNGSAWDQAGTGVTSFTGTAAGGTVTRTLVSTFSPFSLANTVDGQNPLPVNFSDVKAFEKGTGVQIEWTNLTEKDVLTYTVERSANGLDFTPISQVGSRSNQSDKQSYLSFDASPLSGTNYYRIKVLEADGKIVLSKVLKVDIGRNVKGISVYPNPVTGNDITIGFTAVKGQYVLRVINNAGQEVYSKQLVHLGGSISQSVELPGSLRTGVYNLMISGDNYRETKMFIMQ